MLAEPHRNFLGRILLTAMALWVSNLVVAVLLYSARPGQRTASRRRSGLFPTEGYAQMLPEYSADW